MERGILQPAAPGLLSLLQLKQRGANPDSLSDTVVPVIDLTHWYGIDQQKVAFSYGNFSGAALYSSSFLLTAPATITVPDDEYWWVSDVQVAISGNSATITAWGVQALAPVVFFRESDQGVRGTMIGQSNPASSSAALGGLAASGFALRSPSLRDFWAPPGAQFGAALTGFVTDAVNVVLVETTVHYVPLKI